MGGSSRSRRSKALLQSQKALSEFTYCGNFRPKPATSRLNPVKIPFLHYFRKNSLDFGEIRRVSGRLICRNAGLFKGLTCAPLKKVIKLKHVVRRSLRTASRCLKSYTQVKQTTPTQAPCLSKSSVKNRNRRPSPACRWLPSSPPTARRIPITINPAEPLPPQSVHPPP